MLSSLFAFVLSWRCDWLQYVEFHNNSTSYGNRIYEMVRLEREKEQEKKVDDDDDDIFNCVIKRKIKETILNLK